jgi:hypothetical protein
MGLLLCLWTALPMQAGGPQLRYEKSFDLAPGAVRSVILDALSGEIKARIAVKSPGVPIHVYVVLEKDQDAAVDKLLQGKRPEKLLASKEKTEDALLEAKVPAKTAFAVLLIGAADRKAAVKVKVTAE